MSGKTPTSTPSKEATMTTKKPKPEPKTLPPKPSLTKVERKNRHTICLAPSITEKVIAHAKAMPGLVTFSEAVETLLVEKLG